MKSTANREDPFDGLPMEKSEPEEMPADEPEVAEVVEEPKAPSRLVGGGLDLPAMAAGDPSQVVAAVEVYHKALATLRRLALSELRPMDLRLYASDAGPTYAKIAASGARKIMWHVGIEVIPDMQEPQIKTEDDGSRTAWITGTARWTMGRLTVPGIYAARNSEEDFAGRQQRTKHLSNGDVKVTSTEPIGNNDLKAAARTLLDSKAIEAMLGVGGIPVEELGRLGIQVDDIPKAHGFGSADDRRAGKTATPEVKEQAQKLWNVCLEITGGEKTAAEDLLQSVTKGTKPGRDGKVFQGYRSHERMTQDWQVENAKARLKKTPEFKDFYGKD